ncbi:MAG: peptidoglycan recognition family protein [Hyphomicrobium sp.]|nr:peptidoglycan recognition family protein [Hyphomicrobium sp.]
MLRSNDPLSHAFRVALAVMMLLSLKAPAVAEETGAATPSEGMAACGRPPMIDRAGWNAKPARTDAMKTQTVTSIVLHDTRARSNPGLPVAEKMQNLQSYAMSAGRVSGLKKPAWGDVPYHFYIGIDGQIAEGRGLDYAGDSLGYYQTQSKAQIVLEGDFDVEEPSDAQVASLKSLVCWLKRDYKIDGTLIFGHGQLASVPCPGPNLVKRIPDLR